MTKHTPGPWAAYKTEITANKTILIGEASVDVTVKRDVAEANAKLMAAAPKLLAALEVAEAWMVDVIEGCKAESSVTSLPRGYPEGLATVREAIKGIK